MYIQKLRMRNWMAFDDQELDFTGYTGLVLIEGRNGAGKSAILDAITWCLFGKTLRPTKRAKASDVMRRGGEGRTIVTLDIKIGGREITVERSRSKSTPNLRVTGIEASGTTAGIQQTLLDMIGYTFESFCASVMFGGSTSSFCAMTDSERKEILEQMLEVDYFLEAQAQASRLAQESADELRKIDHKLESVRDGADEYRDMLLAAREKESRFAEEREEEHIRLLEEHDRIIDVREEAVEAFLRKRDEYNITAEETEKKHGVWEGMCTEIQTKYDAKSDEVNSVRGELSAEEARVDMVQTDIEEKSSTDHPDVCPTCGQRWPQKKAQSLDTYLEAQKNKLSEHQSKAASIRKRLMKLKDEAAAISDNLNSLLKEEPERPVSLDRFRSREEDRMRRAISAADMSRMKLDEIRREKQNPHTETVKAFEERIAESEKQLEKLSGKRREHEENEFRYRYWATAFSRKGLPSYLIDASIPALNKAALDISEQLTDGNLFVRFNPAAEKGSSSVLDVEVEYEDGADVYDMTSRGEHSRVDLTVLFAIRELVASRGRNDCPQVFIDEVFDGLDSEGMQSVASLLRKRYGDSPVFIISHSDEFKGYVDDTLTVEKEDGVSKVA